MDINHKVAAKISELRLQKNILQTALADSLNMSQNAYSQLENGTTRITVEKLFAIANYFRIPVTQLLDIPENIMFNTSENSTAINTNNRTLNNHLHDESFSKLYEKIVIDKDKVIYAQEETIKLQNEALNNLKNK